jgi:hypothetical protein
VKQGDQMSFWKKIAQNVDSQTQFLLQLMHYFSYGQKVAQNFGSFNMQFSKKPPKVNDSPIAENSPNLGTLLENNLHTVRQNPCSCHVGSYLIFPTLIMARTYICMLV